MLKTQLATPFFEQCICLPEFPPNISLLCYCYCSQSEMMQNKHVKETLKCLQWTSSQDSLKCYIDKWLFDLFRKHMLLYITSSDVARISQLCLQRRGVVCCEPTLKVSSRSVWTWRGCRRWGRERYPEQPLTKPLITDPHTDQMPAVSCQANLWL